MASFFKISSKSNARRPLFSLSGIKNAFGNPALLICVPTKKREGNLNSFRHRISFNSFARANVGV